MDDLIGRLIPAAAYLWAAVEIARVGEKASAWVRGLVVVGSLVGAAWWAVLAIVDPAPVTFVPWWTATSRVAPIMVPVGVAIMGRRRREINGYH